MTMQKIRLGHNEDGTEHWHYRAPDGHVVLTGPHTGNVRLRDGAIYDVTDTAIEVESPEHAAELVGILDARPLPASDPA